MKSISSNDDALYTRSGGTEKANKTFEIREIITSDLHGNPTLLSLQDENRPSDHFKALITYDQNPNTFYSTLEAAGFIPLLEEARVQFTPSEAMQKDQNWLTVHNPISVLITDDQNDTIASLNISYTYNDRKYPTAATVIISHDDGTSEKLSTSRFDK